MSAPSHMHYKKLCFDLRLLVKHPTIKPADITQELGLIPSTELEVGKPKRTPAGTPLPGTYTETKWGTISRCTEQRRFFDAVASLCEQLQSRRDFLLHIVETGGSIEIIVHLPGSMNIGDTINWSHLKALADLRIDLGIEVFPDFS